MALKSGTPVSDRDRLERQINRIADALPAKAGRLVRWLNRPSSRWIRIPSGMLLILFGLVGFLPILGFWMIPLGALLLAQDFPFLRGPTAGVLEWGERKWSDWRARSRPGAD